MLSKEFQLELGEFNKHPGEMAAACMLCAGVDIQTLDSWLRQLETLEALETDFAKAIVNAPKGADEEQVLGAASDVFRGEFPELEHYLTEVFCDYDDENDDLFGNDDF